MALVSCFAIVLSSASCARHQKIDWDSLEQNYNNYSLERDLEVRTRYLDELDEHYARFGMRNPRGPELRAQIRELKRRIAEERKLEVDEQQRIVQEKQLEASKQQQLRADDVILDSPVIESQVDGEFEGWDGDTVVKLMNGQEWQQADAHYYYHYAFMPDVLVYPSNGVWKMSVEGTDRAVRVTRLK